MSAVAAFAQAATTCKDGHALQAFITPRSGTCDGCQKAVAKGSRVKDCRKCNWFLCAECFPETTCPKGHALARFVTPHAGACDGCEERISQGGAVMNCQDCNWFLCARCAPAAIAEEEERLAKRRKKAEEEEEAARKKEEEEEEDDKASQAAEQKTRQVEPEQAVANQPKEVEATKLEEEEVAPKKAEEENEAARKKAEEEEEDDKVTQAAEENARQEKCEQASASTTPPIQPPVEQPTTPRQQPVNTEPVVNETPSTCSGNTASTPDKNRQTWSATLENAQSEEGVTLFDIKVRPTNGEPYTVQRRYSQLRELRGALQQAAALPQQRCVSGGRRAAADGFPRRHPLRRQLTGARLEERRQSLDTWLQSLLPQQSGENSAMDQRLVEFFKQDPPVA